MKQFESVYSPELVGGDMVFTDYEMILGKPTEQQWLVGARVFKAAWPNRRWQ